MSAPAARPPAGPAGPARPGLVAVPAGPASSGPAVSSGPAGPAAGPRPRPTSPVTEELERLRENLVRVLAGMRWPACRWQVLAEAEAWGVSGVVRQQLVPLPDGRYPSLEALLDVLGATVRGRLRAAPPVGPAAGADRLHPAERAVLPHRRPAAVPRYGGHRPARRPPG